MFKLVVIFIATSGAAPHSSMIEGTIPYPTRTLCQDEAAAAQKADKRIIAFCNGYKK